MKIVVRKYDSLVKPKQSEGKLQVRFEEYFVTPKPEGVSIKKFLRRSVLKTDALYGVVIVKKPNNDVLKQND